MFVAEFVLKVAYDIFGETGVDGVRSEGVIVLDAPFFELDDAESPVVLPDVHGYENAFKVKNIYLFSRGPPLHSFVIVSVAIRRKFQPEERVPQIRSFLGRSRKVIEHIEVKVDDFVIEPFAVA